DERKQSFRSIETFNKRRFHVVTSLAELVDRSERQRIGMKLFLQIEITLVPVWSEFWQVRLRPIKCFHRSRPQTNARISRSHQKMIAAIVKRHDILGENVVTAI